MKIRDRIRELRRVPAGRLIPHPANWRTHPDEQRDALRGVLAEVGIAGACIGYDTPAGVQLIDGHLRTEEIGPHADVPVLILDVDDAEAKKLLATFDPLSALAGTDADRLDALLRDVQTDSPAVEAMLRELAEASPVLPEAGGGGDEFDATPEASGPTRTAPGDLWVIGGKHRLLVGDNTDPANVARLMDGRTVGLCFTSPPYAQQRDYGDAAKEKVQDWHALMCGTFANLPMADNGQVLVNLGLVHRDGEWEPYWDGWIEWMREQGWRRFGWYVWDQGSGLAGDFGGRFAPSHEFVFHFNRTRADLAKCVEKKPENVRLGSGTGTRNADGTMKGYRSNPEASLATHKIPDSVIRVCRQMHGMEGHPAPYPVGLPTVAIEAYAGDVYDPFLGSGTTLIAAHRLKAVGATGASRAPLRGRDPQARRAEGLTVERASSDPPRPDPTV
jgi:DNA modification methylase